MSAEYTLYSRIGGIEAGTQTVANDDDENGKHWQDSESATLGDVTDSGNEGR